MALKELRSGRQFLANAERTARMYSCNRLYTKAKGWEKWLEKPDGTASYNNRSLKLRKTFGLTKSEWEPSEKIVPIRVFMAQHT